MGLHYKLSVALRALPRQLLIARHIKVVVPGAREDDLASPEYHCRQCYCYYYNVYQLIKLLSE